MVLGIANERVIPITMAPAPGVVGSVAPKAGQQPTKEAAATAAE